MLGSIQVRNLALVLRSLQKNGAWRTLQIFLLHAESAWFDLRYGTDTRRRVSLDRLHIESPTVGHGFKYDASPVSPLRRLWRTMPIKSTDVFVDYGSGKGRVLLLGLEFPFHRIVGIEFSEELCHIARCNVARVAKGQRSIERIEIMHADAAQVVVQPEWTVFFFFNPFDGIVMKQVVENIHASVTICPRQIRVLYYTPVHRAVLDECGFMRLEKRVCTMGREFLLYASEMPRESNGADAR